LLDKLEKGKISPEQFRNSLKEIIHNQVSD
jgi:hypothetical protein